MSSIADILINSGLSREQLDECRKIAGSSGETLDRVILQKGYLPEDDLLQSYGLALGFEFLAELAAYALRKLIAATLAGLGFDVPQLVWVICRAPQLCDAAGKYPGRPGGGQADRIPAPGQRVR